MFVSIETLNWCPKSNTKYLSSRELALLLMEYTHVRMDKHTGSNYHCLRISLPIFNTHHSILPRDSSADTQITVLVAYPRHRGPIPLPLLCNRSRLAPRPRQLPVQWLMGVISQDIKRLVRENDH